VRAGQAHQPRDLADAGVTADDISQLAQIGLDAIHLACLSGIGNHLSQQPITMDAVAAEHRVGWRISQVGQLAFHVGPAVIDIFEIDIGP
jgi:hypothetical protein